MHASQPSSLSMELDHVACQQVINHGLKNKLKVCIKGEEKEDNRIKHTALVLKHRVQHLPSPAADKMYMLFLVEAGSQKTVFLTSYLRLTS